MNNEFPIFDDLDPRCPHCGSDDEILYLACGCCAECDNCGTQFAFTQR